jgi:hypothetical protein
MNDDTLISGHPSASRRSREAATCFCGSGFICALAAAEAEAAKAVLNACQNELIEKVETPREKAMNHAASMAERDFRLLSRDGI